MKSKPFALISTTILFFGLTFAHSADEVTNETLQKICPKLEIKKRQFDANWLGVEINIPANEVRFKRLFQAWFIISNDKGELGLRVPMQIINIDGEKRILVDASPEMIKNARIDLDCKKEDPTMSSLDTVTLVPSLIGKKE